MSESPPVEHYARCSVPIRGLIIEPGLELREGDDFDQLSDGLAWMARWIGLGIEAQPARLRMQVCEGAAAEFERRWPGRAWFVEIHDAHLDRWTQSYQPYGMPRRR